MLDFFETSGIMNKKNTRQDRENHLGYLLLMGAKGEVREPFLYSVTSAMGFNVIQTLGLGEVVVPTMQIRTTNVLLPFATNGKMIDDNGNTLKLKSAIKRYNYNGIWNGWDLMLEGGN